MKKEGKAVTSMPASRGLSRGWRWGLGIGAAAAMAALGRPLLLLAGQFLLALLFTAAALPLCRRLEGFMRRSLAALLAVAAFMAALLALIGGLAPLIVAQISLVVTEAPRLLSDLMEQWRVVSQQEWVGLLGLDRNGPGEWIRSTAAWVGESLPGLISGMVSGIDAVSRAFLSPVIAYYFLRDREIFSYRASLWIPSPHRKRVLAAWQEMRREAGGYVRGQTLVALAVAALTSLGLLLVGVPAWLILGLLMGACEWIPYVGPLIGGVPIALFSLPLGIRTLLWSLGVTVLVQQIEGCLLSPRLMSGVLELHPVSILLLLSAGGLVGGLAGMAAALPAFVCVRGALRVWWATRADAQPPIP